MYDLVVDRAVVAQADDLAALGLEHCPAGDDGARHRVRGSAGRRADPVCYNSRRTSMAPRRFQPARFTCADALGSRALGYGYAVYSAWRFS